MRVDAAAMPQNRPKSPASAADHGLSADRIEGGGKSRWGSEYDYRASLHGHYRLLQRTFGHRYVDAERGLRSPAIKLCNRTAVGEGSPPRSGGPGHRLPPTGTVLNDGRGASPLGDLIGELDMPGEPNSMDTALTLIIQFICAVVVIYILFREIFCKVAQKIEQRIGIGIRAAKDWIGYHHPRTATARSSSPMDRQPQLVQHSE